MTLFEILLRLAAGLLLTAANAFFVLTEFALTRIAELGEDALEDEPRLRRALEMTDRLEIYLTGCQLGITSSSILLGVVAEPAVTHLVRPAAALVGLEGRTLSVTSVVLAVVVINLIHKIWGEQAPTYLGVERPRASAVWTAPVHFWWTRLTYPLIKLGDGLAKWTLGLIGVEIRRSWTAGGDDGEAADGEEIGYAEVRRRMGEVLSRGNLSRERKLEVLRALEIQRTPVRDVMVPREEVATLSTESTPEENFRVLAENGRVRYPLVRGSLEDFVGTVYLPAVMARLDALRSGEASFEEIASNPLELPADLPVSQAIDRFQEASQELALIVQEDADGGRRVCGLLTATDALEAIAGELEDPLDAADATG